MRTMSLSLFCLLTNLSVSLLADETAPLPQFKHHVAGLFSPDREQDLKDICANLTGIQLISVDFPNAEAVFAYDPAKTFNNPKPEQVVERFDSLLRQASKSTFSIRPLRTTPLDKLERVEIGVVGLDCKACSLALYEIVVKLKGVEMATASFKNRKVTAWIDPQQIARTDIEATLKQRGVQLATTDGAAK